MVNAPEEWLTVPEVAAETRSTIWAVRFWIRTGKLKASRPGKHLLVRRRDLVAMLKASEVNHAR